MKNIVKKQKKKSIMGNQIDQVKFLKQKRIKVEGGDVLCMKKSNSNSFKFGEAISHLLIIIQLKAGKCIQKCTVI